MPRMGMGRGEAGADRPLFAEGAVAFCPECRGGGSTPGGLCPGCGGRMVGCGFCPTCEEAWRLPIGETCPKHDVPLEPAPEPSDWRAGREAAGDRWVTVATYAHPNEANAPRIRLEAEGVPTFLDGERVAGTTLYQVATGGARLQVPASLAATARVLLAQRWTAPPTPDAPDGGIDEDEDDDPWAGLAPEPGARRRAIMKGAILVVLFGPGLIGLANFLAYLLGRRI